MKSQVDGRRIGGNSILLLFVLFGNSLWSQKTTDTLSISNDATGILTGQLIVHGDTIPWSVLDEVLFVPKPTLTDYQARRNYYNLTKKVNRVYPYVREAALRMDTLNRQLDGINKRYQKKKYIKDYQKFLEDRFEPELRKLTRSEGQILSKLIYRETGTSVFEIIKTYRNGFSARIWSLTAWWYDIDLKRAYDPMIDPEDKLIENILVRNFISGALIPAHGDELLRDQQ
jgi:hypothetical protein